MLAPFFSLVMFYYFNYITIIKNSHHLFVVCFSITNLTLLPLFFSTKLAHSTFLSFQPVSFQQHFFFFSYVCLFPPLTTPFPRWIPFVDIGPIQPLIPSNSIQYPYYRPIHSFLSFVSIKNTTTLIRQDLIPEIMLEMFGV